MTSDHSHSTAPSDVVCIVNPAAQSPVVLICEHASNYIPEAFQGLGLTPEVQRSHVAWDPGAMAVAMGLSERFDAQLVASEVSRLIYDCNRPPSAPDAMPARSEVHDIPGNVGLSPDQRDARATAYYAPFRAAVADALSRLTDPVIVTVHSFTPVYLGKTRDVDIGVLHDADGRLADAMLAVAGDHTPLRVLRNAPYGPEHGVTHTLKEHALPAGRLNVMLEIRNDAIATAQQQADMADALAAWLIAALAALGRTEDPREETCQN